MRRVLLVIGTVLVLFGTLVAVAISEPPQRTGLIASQVQHALLAHSYADGRGVLDVACLSDGTGRAQRATHFLCREESFKRPASVSPARWSRILRTVRAGDLPKALGLPTGASRADLLAAATSVGLGRTAVDVYEVDVDTQDRITYRPAVPGAGAVVERALQARS